MVFLKLIAMVITEYPQKNPQKCWRRPRARLSEPILRWPRDACVPWVDGDWGDSAGGLEHSIKGLLLKPWEMVV